MKQHIFIRLLSLMLASVMVLGLIPGASAASSNIQWKRSRTELIPDRSDRLVEDQIHTPDPHKPTDLVRVSIVLEDTPTLKAGYSTQDIAHNGDARAYDLALKQAQKDMANAISRHALGGSPLDVVWNLTLAANIISANVPYGKLSAIEAVSGVKKVVLERSYDAPADQNLETNTHSSSAMIGASQVWETGLTGAGTRVAIIDTGTDTDHQSFSSGAFLHALKQTGKEVDLLDVGEINEVLPLLNATERIGSTDGSSYYLNEKLPFGANYVDRNLTIDHDHDYQGSHGSHVAGIAAANRFIPKNGSFLAAQDSVRMLGVAPDAQILTMKVFGNSAGPYDSDFFAAIEDAIWLGCDSVNLSLGAGAPGSSENPLFAELLDFLATTETVVVMSAGNSGHWAEATTNSYLYHDGVSFQTSGTPGTYTNSLAVASVDNSQTVSDSGAYTMSSFSSWGVPGSLELKPEITAPGGSIYSVNGVDPSGTAYETMSGTSMAAPQVSGMAALVSQYIREKGLDRQTGLSVRHLAQSLLMSTAVPVMESGSEGGYYSILNQGSGLARVDLAVSAGSYLLVEGMADGKVKVELGDDPDREGIYRFRFSIHDLSGREQTYALSADLFTQALFDDGNTGILLDTATRPLDAAVTFTGSGVIQNETSFSCDLNGDGYTNSTDADHLLEYLLGNAEKLHADGDLDGDGNLDSHDAHLLLSRFTGGSCIVTVPSGGSASIQVTLSLTAEEKARLAEENPTGAYIEAFVHAVPQGDGVAHSIPVLGYYGSWTEPSMYDIGRYHDHTTGQEVRAPYLSSLNGIQSNYLTIDYGDGKKYIFGGNPFAQETEYLPQRNAFNNTVGAMLTDLRYTLIRNAPATRLLIENADTGEVLVSEEQGAMEGAYYHVNTGYWMNTQYHQAVGLWLEGIPEGTTLNISFLSAPEYYCTYDPNIGIYTADWESLSSGAYLTVPVTVDNTAPELLDLELVDGRYLRLTAKDNEYIAAAALLNPSGTNTLVSVAANQTQPGKEMTIELDLKDVFGQRFKLALYDYAENTAVYDITLELATVRPELTAYSFTVGAYVGLDRSGSTLTLAPTQDRKAALAAEYVDGMVYEITEDHQLWLGSDKDLSSFRLLRPLDPDGTWKIANFLDLAYHRTEGKLYTLFYSNLNDKDAPYLATIDLYTGRMTVLGEMPIDVYSLTIDGEGNFYSACYGFSRLYTYRSDVVSTKKSTLVGTPDGYKTTELHSMAWDHNKNVLYWAVNTQNASTLVTVDPKTAATGYVAQFPFAIRGLYIAYTPNEAIFAPCDTVDSVTVNPTASVLKGKTTRLTAQVWPWNIRDDSVTWTSSNPAVATVSPDGTVQGISAGTAVITAASRLDPGKSASCTLTVTALSSDLKALVWDEEGTIWWSSFNTDTLPGYTKLSATDKPFNATMTANGQLYASTLDTTYGVSELYRVDPKTYAAEKIGDSSAAYMDMAYAPSLGYGLGVYFGYVVLINLQTGDYDGAWPWSEDGAAELVGITYCGTSWNDLYRANVDEFLLLDANGKVYRDFWVNTGSNIGYFNGPEYGFLGQLGEPVVPSYFQGFHYDGSYVYWTRYHEPEDQVELIVWDMKNTGEVHTMGKFPEKIWPVGGLYTDADLSGSKSLGASELKRTDIHPMTLTNIPTQAVMPLSKTQVSADNTLRLDVTAPYDATNTMLEISYDPKKLELTGIDGLTEAFAWSKGDGTVRIAAASRGTISAEDPMAQLRFSPVGEGETAVTVTTTELGIDHLTLTETIAVTLSHICPSESFVDVNPGDWWHEAVDYVVSRGYMNGMDGSHYGPAATMNRAQFVTVLYRMEGQPQVNNTGIFTDVPDGQFFTNAAYWALQSGITTGATATTFNPGGRLTRTELVTFMYRYAKFKGYDTTATADVSIYRDRSQILPFALEPWRWSVTQGIVSGMTADTLAPMSLTNRAQAAIIFQRFDNKLAG